MEKFDKAKLKQQLSPLQDEVCINKGTERPFTGEYWDNHEPGVYVCVVCGKGLVNVSAAAPAGSKVANLNSHAGSRPNRTAPTTRQPAAYGRWNETIRRSASVRASGPRVTAGPG